MDVETVVIGAGVIGLAAARDLALRGHEVMVLEEHTIIGSQTSARNSEVIHAGIYYPAGSLKAHACLAGRELLYRFCEENGVPHRRLGKLIVATAPDQVETLSAIRARAEANGVDDLRFLTRAEALALEPHLACEGALLSPSTGIIDSHAFMQALQGGLEAHGGQVVCGTKVTGLGRIDGGYRLTVADGADGFALTCRNLVIAAGHGAPSLAALLSGTQAPKAYFARGCYFSISGRAPFSRLVYPVPEPGGLGVHLTLDMGGQARFGPDVEWIDGLDYTVDPRRADGFYAEIRKYWPGLADGALRPDYSGIRPKISGPGEPAADFRIDGPREHGHAGLVALYGIESPGLTSALALAGLVADRLGE
ncbi:NAD(P)/FAD-dependent oxidoreductase [Stappia sp. WLB 29]|uniref:NAD(P)/FAD-dependent oxidoreductase n=1 Tax=Stappia sp. WLB 29 TaxID=2925220 RepID=UPI0020C0863A|nr:NAD(P)/FAD-dependent oxidoreductase [Stappia sp. WLB 29]